VSALVNLADLPFCHIDRRHSFRSLLEMHMKLNRMSSIAALSRCQSFSWPLSPAERTARNRKRIDHGR